MADAIPVHSGKNSKAPAPEATTNKMTAEELHARAAEIVAAETPVVPDALVNSIGQASSYGKYKHVIEHRYPEKDESGKVVPGKFNTTIIVHH